MGRTALIVIDMINTYDHPDVNLLLPSVHEVVPHAAALLERARHRDAPVIYVHDNFGEWRSHHGELLDSALARQRLSALPCPSLLGFPGIPSRKLTCRATALNLNTLSANVVGLPSGQPL